MLKIKEKLNYTSLKQGKRTMCRVVINFELIFHSAFLDLDIFKHPDPYLLVNPIKN